MKQKLNKIEISKLPSLFITIMLIIVFLLFLISNKYIYAIISFLIITILSFKIKIPKFPIILFIVSIITKILIILVINPPIESDFLTMYKASKMLAIGDLSYTKNPYFITWAYQTGHVVYQTLLLKICDSVLFLKIMNCLFLSGTNVLIYLILKNIINEKAAKFASLSYLCYLNPILLTTVLTNQHFPTFLFFLSLYFVINKNIIETKPIVKYLLIGIIIGIGNVLRPEGIVFILTIIVYLICVENKYEKPKTLITKSIVLLLGYIIIVKGTAFTFQTINISKNGLTNKDPLWKFVLGTNYESQGMYTDSDLIYLEDEEKELEVIKNRTIENPTQFLKLLVKKSKIFWINNNLYWSNNYLEAKKLNIFNIEILGTKVNEYLNAYNEHIYIISFILSIIGLLFTIKSKKYKEINIFTILLSIYFIVYLFIEIMIRYTYTPRIAIFILSGIGANSIYEEIKKIKNKKKKTKKHEFI